MDDGSTKKLPNVEEYQRFLDYLEQSRKAEVPITSPLSFSLKTKIIGVLVAILLIAGLVYGAAGLVDRITNAEEEVKKAKVLTQQSIVDKNVLQNKYDMSSANAGMLAEIAKKAMAGQVAPNVSFNVTAPDVQTAAVDVSNRINAKDPTLPPAALGKTDYTFVVPNTTNPKDFKVDVYKVNTYKNWEITPFTGVGVHNGSVYLPFSVQRNFSKNRSLEVSIHVGRGDNDDNSLRVRGGEIKYKIHTDKLFGLF